MTTRLFPALGLSMALLIGACTNPDGSVDAGNTALLVGGVALLGAAVFLADDDTSHRDRDYRRDRNRERSREESRREERRRDERRDERRERRQRDED